MIVYSRHPRFEGQIKKLLKKYRTLEDDLLIAQNAAIELWHIHHLDNCSVELVPGFDKENVQIYKLRKFACKSLSNKGVRSGIRVIYAFYPKEMKVEFLEIYYKNRNDTDMDYDLARLYIGEYGE